MLFRGLLFFLMLFFIARAVWRLLGGIVEGAMSTPGGRAASGPAAVPQAMKLTRDPICGTFVVPGKAVEFVRGGEKLYFCSDTCRRRFLEKA